MRVRPIAALLIASLALAIGAGCPKRSRRTLVPKVPTHGDAEARHRFERAQQKFERDNGEGHADEDAGEFESIAEEYPDDPVAPYALLYAGIAASKAGDHERATDSLEKLASDPNAGDGLRTRGALFHGVALAYLGRHADALGRLRAGEDAIESDAERTEWHAAMAESLARTGAAMQSLAHYDAWYDEARASERAYIRDRLRELVGAASAADLRAAYGALDDRRSPSAAYVGLALSAALQASGDTEAAEEIRNQTAEARRRLGLGSMATGGAADPRLVGAVLPMSGKRGPIGEVVTRGLTMAAGAVGVGRGLGIELSVADAAKDTPMEAVDRVIGQGAVALIGPITHANVELVADRAGAAGVPVISLDPRPRATAPGRLFHITPSAEERARALARYAHENGARDFAVLAPRSGYGRAVSAAFAAEVRELGGTVVIEKDYAPDTTSFTDVVKTIRKPWQAIFVPDSAARLALIAPALAAANLFSRPVEGSRPRRGRKILLLSTAEAVDDRYLRSAGRYSEGAVLAPGFYPDRDDAKIGAFVDRYEEAYGKLPGTWEAYAYDASLVVRAAAGKGARTRGEMAAALSGIRVEGLTGEIAFGADGRRAPGHLLFRVERRSEDASDYVIRALRD